MKVLCFGSLNIDYTYCVKHFVEKGETLSADSLKIFCGGKGLNQSVALAKAGADTYHAGAIGQDGIFLLRQLEAAGVSTKHVEILEHEQTGHAIIQNDTEGDNCILLYGGANRAITKQQIDNVLIHFKEGDWLVLQNEINEMDYIMEQGHKTGMKIALTPAPMEKKILSYPLEYVNYLFLNRVEAAQILELETTKEVSGEELSLALHKRFPSAEIILTLGEAGAVYISSKEIIKQPAYSVKAIDTTAAGDTFAGFFIGGLIRKLSVREAMVLAAKAAAIAVTRPGASPSIPSLEEAEGWNN